MHDEGTEIATEVPGGLGLLLYMTVGAVQLWSETAPAAREGLFSRTAVQARRDLLDGVTLDLEIRAAVTVLTELVSRPAEFQDTAIAYAALRISSWAAARGARETAAAFARAAEAASPELVARLQAQPGTGGDPGRSVKG